jgi:hypothetical protein
MENKYHMCICGSLHLKKNYNIHKRSLKHKEFTKDIMIPRPLADPIVRMDFDF